MIDYGRVDSEFSIRAYKKWREPSIIKRLFMSVSPAGYTTWAIAGLQQKHGMIKFINEINPKINAIHTRRHL